MNYTKEIEAQELLELEYKRQLRIELIDYITSLKSSIFQEYTFNNEDLNKLLWNTKWYQKCFILRNKTLKDGYYGVYMFISGITNKFAIKLVNINYCELTDDIWTRIDVSYIPEEPDYQQEYNFQQYKLNSKLKCVDIYSGKYKYQQNEWVISYITKERSLPIDFIPIQIFPNNEYYVSMFENKKYIIDLILEHCIQILDDIQIGTNKFIINLAGIPNEREKIFLLNAYNAIIRKRRIISDNIIQLNPNVGDPVDKMYGSLQNEQLIYGKKMALATLKEFCLIAVSSNSKNSAQQNNMEIAQDNQAVNNDNNKNKYIWENILIEFGYKVLKVNNILGKNNLPIPKDLKATIKLATNELDLLEKNQEKENKKVVNNDRTSK